MANQRIYCEVDFLKKFLEIRPTAIVPTEENISQHKMWINVFEFIFKSELLLDNKADFATIAKENELFLILWKKSIEDPDKLDFLESDYPDFDNFNNENYKTDDYLTSIFLTTSEDVLCEKIQDSFGIIVFNFSQIFTYEKYFVFNMETIESGNKSHSNWDFLANHKHHCNSLCLVDNYIFSDTINIDKNLIPILDKLLPEKLKIPFHISIFTILFKGKEMLFDVSALSKDIKNKIKEIRPNLQITLGFFSSNSKDFHDRAIISNSMIIESGSGFDLFKPDRYSDNKMDIAIHQTKIISYYHHFLSNVTFSKKGKPVNIHQFLLASLTKSYTKDKIKVAKKGNKFYFENRLLENN